MWKTWSKCLPSLSRSCGRTVLKTRAAHSGGTGFWFLEQLASGLSEARRASLPAGQRGQPEGRAAGCAPSPLAAGGLRSGPLSRWLHSPRAPLAGRGVVGPLGSPPTRPPAAVHSHSARPLRPPRVASASLSAAGGSSVAALPGEPPGESQARGRIINHPRSPVPSARWFAPCAPGSSCTIAGSVAPRGSEGKRKQGETTQKLSSWTVLKWGREVPWCLPPRHVLLFRSLHQTHTKQELVYHPHSTKVVLTNTLRC